MTITIKVYHCVNGDGLSDSLEPILSIKRSVSIGTMLNFDCDGHGDMCKQTLKACLHVPSPCPCTSMSPSNFIIVSMETDRLMDRMGSEPHSDLHHIHNGNLTDTEMETVRVNRPLNAQCD